MGLKTFTIDFAEYTKHQYLRFDEKFWYTTKNLAVYNYILLKDVFNLVNGNSYTEYYTEEKTDIPYIRIGDLTFKFEIDDKNLIYLDDSIELNKEQILKDDDLILATIGATIGKINLAREFKGGTFSNNTILLRLKNKENHNPYFYEKLFQTSLLQKYIWGVVSQKAQPNLQTYDLLNIKIPLLPKTTQDQIVDQIEPIEKKIKELKVRIKPPQEIINEIFAREFEFDLEKFEENKKVKFFEVDFTDIASDFLLISKVKFHKYDLDYLETIKTIRLKEISEFIKSGNAEKYEEVCEEGNYISVEDLNSNGRINSSKFTSSKAEILKLGDILFSRVGSKLDTDDVPVGLVEFEYQKFASDNILIISLNKFNNEFVMFFLKSIFGNKQIRKVVKTKGQPVINSTTLGNIKIPNIPLKAQQKIVDEIKAELDKQEEIKKQIEIERNKIDEIIEKAIK